MTPTNCNSIEKAIDSHWNHKEGKLGFLSGLRFPYLPAFLAAAFVLIANIGSGQYSVQNFGTSAGSYSSTTGSTSFLPAPTVGTTYAQAGAASVINLQSVGGQLGTADVGVMSAAATTGSITKFSPIISYGNTAEFYTSFKVLFGDKNGLRENCGGTWTFYQGNNSSSNFSNTSDIATANAFAALRFTAVIDVIGDVNLAYNNGSSYINTGLTVTKLSGGSAKTIEIFGNNKLSGDLTYIYKGVTLNVPPQAFDLYIDGTLVGNDLKSGGLSAGLAVNSMAFVGTNGFVATISRFPLHIFLDDVVVSTSTAASANDVCANATTLTPGAAAVYGNLSTATVDAVAVKGANVWYTFTPACTGTVTVSTLNGGQDIDLFAFSTNCPSASGQRIAAATSTSTVSETLQFSVTAGTTYYISVEKATAGVAGVFGISVSGSVAGSVSTMAATNISHDSLVLNGNVTALSNCPNTTEKGFVYAKTSLNANPLVGGANCTKVVVAGIATGDYSSPIKTLTPLTGYSYKAYIFDGSTYIYGSTTTVTTSDVAPTITPAANATVDAAFTLTFTDNSTWRNAITSITVGGQALPAAAYDKTVPGQITLDPAASALLQSPGTKTITIIANGYANAIVSQPILYGTAVKLSIVTQPTAPLTNGGLLGTQPVVAVQDQYGNTVANSSMQISASVSNPPQNWTLGGTPAINALNGLASFTNLTAASSAIQKSASIIFSGSPGINAVTSSSFIIPPINDGCSNAIPLVINADAVTGDVEGASQSIAAISCQAKTGNANDDLWYSFTTTAAGDYTITIVGASAFNAVVDLRSGSCNGTNIQCADATLAGGTEQITASLAATTTYYARVYDFGSGYPSTPTFTISVSTAGTYYSKSSGLLNSLSTWGTNPDGSGAAPVSFNAANTVFNVVNNASPTINAAWNVSGLNSKVVVASGISFTVPNNTGFSGKLDLQGNAFFINASSTNPAFGTLDAGSTVDYAGTGAQTIISATYGSISNSGNGPRTLQGYIIVSRNYSPSSGAITVTGSTIEFSNSTSLQAIPGSSYNNIIVSGIDCHAGQGVEVNGTLTVNGPLALDGLLRLNPGSSLIVAANKTMSVGGTLENKTINPFSISGSLIVSGKYIHNVNANTIPKTNTSYQSSSEILIGNGEGNISTTAPTLPASSYVVVWNTPGLSAPARFLSGANTTVKYFTVQNTGGSYITNGDNATSQQLTIENDLYVTGGAYQIVAYNNTSATASQTTIVNGNLSVSGGTLYITSNRYLSGGNGILRVAGNIEHSGGSFGNAIPFSGALTSGTLHLTGTAVQNFSSIGLNSIVAVTINNTGGGVALNSNLNVISELKFIKGVIHTGNYKVDIQSLQSDPYYSDGFVTGSSQATGWVDGNFQIHALSGKSNYARLFPLGDATDYTPFTITIYGVSTNSTLLAKLNYGLHPNLATSTLSSNKRVKRYYSLVVVNGSMLGNKADFSFTSNDVTSGSDFTKFDVGKYSNGTWAYPTVTTRTATSISFDGPSQNSTNITTSDFVIAEPCTKPVVTTQPLATQTICINTTATNLTVAATGSIAGYQWYSNTSSTNIGGTSLGAAAQSASFTPPTNTAGTFYYYAEVIGDCGSTFSNASTVTVNPNLTTGPVSGASSACIGTQTTFTTAGSPGGTWSSSDPLVASVTNAGVVTTLAAGTTNITYSISGCGSPSPSSQAIVVLPNQTAGVVSGNSLLCVDATTTYTVSGASATGTWSSSNTNAATVDNTTGLATAKGTGTANIMYTISSGCGTPVSASKPITVVTAGIINAPSSICVGSTVSVSTNGSAGGSWTSSNTSVADITTAGVITAKAAGTTIIGYAIGGCSATQTITVNASAIKPELSTSQPTCTTALGAITITSPIGEGYSYSIDGLDYSNTSGVFANVTAGTYQVTSKLAGNSCISPVTTAIINQQPVQTSIIAQPVASKTICKNEIATITVGAIGDNLLYYLYKNTVPSNTGGTGVGDGTPSLSPDIIIPSANTGTYYYYVVVKGTCGKLNTEVSTITVNDLVSTGVISGTNSACKGEAIEYTSNGTAGGAWASSNTTTATIDPATGVATAKAAGTTVISYSISGCGNPAPATIILTVKPNYTITVTPSSNGTISPSTTTLCQGSTQTFTISPASCYTIADVLVDGVSKGSIASYSFNDLNTDHTISAVFAPSAYTITTSAGSGGSISTKALDALPDLRMAVGLRKLVTTYSGPLLKVRRGLDNAEQNIGFAGEKIDASALSNFLQGTTGYCSILYDQSGAGNDMLQSSQSNQPTISIIGQTAVLHFNTSSYLNNDLNPGATYSVVYAARLTGGAKGRVLSSKNSTTNWLLGWWGGVRGMAYLGEWAAARYLPTDANPYVYACVVAPAGNKIFENGNDITDNPGYNASPYGIQMNGSGQYGEYSDVDFMDVVVTSSALSADKRSAIESEIASNYAVSGYPAGNNNGSYSCGANITYQIKAEACHSIADVIVDGISQGAISSYTFSNLSQNHTISASFNDASDNSTLRISACDTYTWHGTIYTQSGTYTFNKPCGTETLELTINHSVSATTTITACDEYTWPVNNVKYTESGIKTYVTQTAEGCTNTQILDLTINASTSETQTIEACDQYYWNQTNQTYTESGTYQFVSTNASNCTHTKYLQLTIKHSTYHSTDMIACDSYYWEESKTTYYQSGVYEVLSTNASNCTHREILNLIINNSTSGTTSQTACDQFAWHINGTTYTYSESGTYIVSTSNVSGCSRVDTLILEIRRSTANESHVTACNSYKWCTNNTIYTESGTYVVTSLNDAGCTHTETLYLTVNKSSNHTSTISQCNNYTWPVNGQTYYASGVYTFTQPGSEGCTNTETLVLTINHGGQKEYAITACDSYTWPANNQVYTASGNYVYTTTNSSQCTVTKILHLTINKSTGSKMSVQACNSYRWPVSGIIYTESGVYTASSINASGCVHTDTLMLTISQGTTHTSNVVACNSYTWAINGQTYTQSGTYSFTSVNNQGCTNTEILNLAINNGSVSTINVAACTSYTWPVNGVTYNTSGTYTYVSPDATECGKTNILNLTITSQSSAGEISGNQTLCIGSATELTNSGTANGTWYSSNAAVANISNTGLVTGLSAGTTTITYTVIGCNGTLTTSIVMHVNAIATAGTISGSSPLCVGAIAQYSSDGTSDGAWTSSNPLVASVSNTGLVTALSVGTTNIIYTVTGCNGVQTASKSLSVSTQSAQINCPAGAPFTRNANSSCVYVVSGNEFNATVNAPCSGPALTYTLSGATTGTGSSLAGVIFKKGTTAVTWSSANGSQPLSCTFNVTVADVTLPALQCTANITQAASGNNCSKSIAVANPTFSDNCGIASVTWTMTGATVANSSASGINYVGTRVFNVGTTTVTYTVTDVSGNTAVCTFTVKITSTKCATPMAIKKELDPAPTSAELVVEVSPNPSDDIFTLKLKSSSKEMVTINVYDMQGKLVNELKGLPTKQFQVGSNYAGGMYMAEIIQNGVHKRLKLIKQ